MKRLSFFLFLFFLWMTVRAQMLRSSGLMLYGGKNTVNYQMASPEKGLPPFDLADSHLGTDFTFGRRIPLAAELSGYRLVLRLVVIGKIWPLQLWIPLSFF